MTSVGGPVRHLALAIILFWVGSAAGCGDNGPGNDAPTGANVMVTTAEDTPVTVTIAASDPDGDALTYTVTTPPLHGAVSGILPAGTYTPARDYHGSDVFFVTVSDGDQSTPVRVDVTVTSVNDAPVAVDDGLADDEDTILTVAASTLLANDTDADGDPLTITEVGAATNGTVVLDGTNVTFTPTADFLGAATFTYTASDGTATDTATVTITVGGVNDGPVAGDDLVTAIEDTALTIPVADLLANDSDTEGQTLTITAVADAVGGAVVLVGTDVTFTPSANFTGAGSFTYTVSDGAAEDTGLVTVTVDAVNDPPVAADDGYSMAEDEPLLLATSTPLDNDVDVDGDTLTITAVSDPVNGTVVLDGTDITFTPARDFNGTASFAYTVSDGTATDTATITLTIGPGNDPPVASDDVASTDEDVPLVIDGAALTGNDTDVDLDPLTVFDVRDPVNGTVDLEGQTITFTPAPNFHGTASFVYTVSDTDQRDTATVTVTVRPVNDGPVAVDDTATTDEDTLLVIATADLIADDTDADGDPLTVTAVGNPVNGVAVLDGTDITFTPAADFTGDATFEYTISDGAGGVDVGLVTIAVVPVNDAPIAVDDTATTAEETALVILAADLLANDSDVENTALTITAVAAGVGGTVALTGAEVTFTPAADFTGDATFTYTVSDGTDSDVGTVTVDVTAVNDGPVAVDDVATTAEDTALVIAADELTANDIDVDGDALTVTAVGDPVNGTVALAGGNVTFTPALNVNGVASFSYTVSDGTASDTAIVTVTVTAVDDGPVAVDDAQSTSEDVPLIVAASVLTANDLDADGSPLTVTAVGGAVNGTVALVAGTVTFTPSADFHGAASFTYTVSDGTATDVGAVAVTVSPVNDAPVAVADARTTSEDVPLVITAASLAANDTDVDAGTTLTVTAVGGAVNGTVALVAGTVTFTPTANFNGAASFTYTVSDGSLTATGAVAVTVTAVNDGPVAVDDARTTSEDTALVITAASLAANDTDTEGSALTVTAVGGAVNGAVALVAGTVTFTPTANFNGAASFTYTVSDGTASDSGLVAVTVTAVNDAPVAVDDADTTAEDVPLVITAASLAANDTDVDAGTTLTVTAVGGAVNGAVALVAGTVTFTPTANFNGAASFTYTVSDGTASDTGLVAVTVTAVNDGPVAVDDARTTNEDTALVVTGASLAANDTDVEGAALTVTAVGGAVNGTVALVAGTVTFTPTANFNGAASFTYTVSDGTASDSGLVAVTVTAVNDGPVAVDDARTTAEDTALVVTGASLAANDTDVEGTALTVTAVGGATNGTVALVAGTVTFTPTANFVGAASFTYTVSDGALTDSGLVAVTVTAVNDGPIAVDDGRTTAEDTALVFAAATLVVNDTDADADTLTVTAVGGATNGTVGLAAGTVTFTPAANFTGSASFTYTVSDGTATDSGLVTVTVTPVNDAPVAVDDADTTAEDVALVVTGASLAANDTDLDADVLTVTAVGVAVNGTVALVAGTVTFTPTANFTGAASFTYTVSDGTLTDGGLVTVTVTAVNDAPVAVDDADTTVEDTALVVTGASLAANDTDVEGTALTVTAVGGATNGTVGLAAGTVTFTPTANFNGAASFTYTVSDGTLTDTGLVTVTVTAVNDAPIAVDDGRTTAEDTALVFAATTLVVNDTDVDLDTLTVTAVGGADNGTVGLAAGTVTFTPTANFSGSGSFTYTVSDGTVTDTGLVTVTVTAVNDLPVAVDDAATIAEDTALVVTGATLASNDSDPENDTLTVTAVGNASNGTVALVAGTVTFTPTPNFNGAASFTYTLSDGTDTDTGAVAVTVTPVPDAPLAVDDAVGTGFVESGVFVAADLLDNDSEVDGDTMTVTAVSGATTEGGTVVLAAGDITYTAPPGFVGDDTFTYTVSDGALTDTGTVTVTVASESFEANYDNWVLGGSGLQFAIATIASAPTTFTASTAYFDFITGANVTWTPSNGGFGPVEATDGTSFAALLVNGPTTIQVTQKLGIPADATELLWDMQYRNTHTQFTPGLQYVAIQILDADTDVVLATPYITTQGVDALTIAMTEFSVDVTAFAGTVVKLRIEMQVRQNYFSSAYDNFRLQ
jgi:hypothetical protein